MNEAGAVIVKSVPVPVSGSDCGLPLASSVTVIAPLRAPVVVGVNVTLIEQDMVAASVAPQVFVSAKSPELAMDMIFRVTLPLFFNVIILAGELVVVTS